MSYKAKRIEEGRYAVRFEISREGTPLRSAVFNQPVIKVGTLSSSGLLLFGDDDVSRMHAVIEVESPDCISVIDLGSRSGTFVNGAKTSKATVNMGDEIRFGSTFVTVRRASKDKTSDSSDPQLGKPDRMNFTECLDWAGENEVHLHFSGPVIYAWIEGGEKIGAVTFIDAINLLRNYSEAAATK